ncbi:MAG: GMC family oxidoreductase [Planctomycetes bacterium]|nr:GMC family oxidoreductase [Planctomycetota bacterium]
MDADVIVVGSGFGGSVCALRAAEAGLRVVVLERGRRMDDAAYEKLADGRLPLINRREQPGLFDIKMQHGLATAGGCAVGGGSHVYTAVTMPAPDEVFANDWPAALTVGRMRELYERAERVLRPTPLAEIPSRTRRMQEIGERMAAPAVVLPLVVEKRGHNDHASPSTLRGHIATWLRGGPGYRKRTLDMSYLAQAERAGTRVLPLHEALSITPIAGGYRVRLRQLVDDDWREGELTARKVVLAAGTMNTVPFLVRCRDIYATLPAISAALGERFYTNGDFGAAVAGFSLDIDRDDGPPVTSWIDCWNTDRLFLMETGAFLGGRVWSIAVMGFDDSPGRLSLDERGRLQHHSAGPSPAFHAARMRRLREFAAAAGGALIAPPAFATRTKPATVHPLGGARMADRAELGVVDANGEMFGYPGLYVADGSILPTPTGVAPSMTIAALAEHVSEHLVSHA